jgi:hypothetical protein
MCALHCDDEVGSIDEPQMFAVQTNKTSAYTPQISRRAWLRDAMAPRAQQMRQRGRVRERSLCLHPQHLPPPASACRHETRRASERV